MCWETHMGTQGLCCILRSHVVFPLCPSLRLVAFSFESLWTCASSLAPRFQLGLCTHAVQRAYRRSCFLRQEPPAARGEWGPWHGPPLASKGARATDLVESTCGCMAARPRLQQRPAWACSGRWGHAGARGVAIREWIGADARGPNPPIAGAWGFAVTTSSVRSGGATIEYTLRRMGYESAFTCDGDCFLRWSCPA